MTTPGATLDGVADDERVTPAQWEAAWPAIRAAGEAILRMEAEDRAATDPRTAHGPAWSEGTPRTAEEAAVLCAQVEPRAVVRARAEAAFARLQAA